MLPFSREVFFSLFEAFNERFAWAHAAALLCFAAAALRIFAGRPAAPARWALGALAAAWAGLAEFWYFGLFARVNFLAPIYGWLAIGQSAALLAAAWASREGGAAPSRAEGAVAWACLALAFAFPFADQAAGPGWPAVRFPGLHAEPLILLTAAAWLRLRPRFRFALCLVPLALAGVAGYAAWALRLPQDWAVPAGTLGAAALALARDRSER